MKRRTVAELHGVTTQKTVLLSVCLRFVFLNSFHLRRKVHFSFQKKLLVDKWGRNIYLFHLRVCQIMSKQVTYALHAPHKWFRNSLTRSGHHEVWFSVSDGEAEEHLWREPYVLVCCCVLTSSYQLSKLVSTSFFHFFFPWSWVRLSAFDTSATI
jgi:hypothetical protein